MKNTINFKEARLRIDMVQYLANMGHQPARKSGEDLWYLSPFHEERHPSFKLDTKFQIWYDHSLGMGGDLIDLGIRIHNCNHAELLEKFRGYLSSEQYDTNKTEHIFLDGQKGKPGEHNDKKIKVVAERPVFKYYLKAYLRERCIPLDLANQYVSEVDFVNKASKEPDKIYTALGFKNSAGGYELRSKNFKSSCSPKTTTFIGNLSPEEAGSKPKAEQSVAVFEGFFSFLSFQVLYFHNKINTPVPDNFLVLNSLSFLKSSLVLLDEYGEKMMLLDNDKSGNAATQMALGMGKDYKDYSHLYDKANDLNALLVSMENPGQEQQESMIFLFQQPI